MNDRPASATIPVLRPKLPETDALIPYLRRIDDTRIYSNLGPLVFEFERRTAALLNLPPGSLVAAGSGTTALVAAILAAAGRARPEKPYALIPAFTFVATAAAVEQCGYIPYLADIDAESWALDPRRLTGLSIMSEVGVVVPVAPFGRPLFQQAWLEFQNSTSIPVVFDGAASFDLLRESPDLLGDLPVVLSFHATKCFATGEGGAIITTDFGLAMRARRALNFGFLITRESRSPSTNGRMSEYHAAVGLAEHDGWKMKRAALESVAAQYRIRAKAAGIESQILTSPDVSTSYALFRGSDAAQTSRVESALRHNGIGSRFWYGLGLQSQPHYADLQREPLPVATRVAPTLLGIPVAPDLPMHAVDTIIGCVVDALSTAASPGSPAS